MMTDHNMSTISNSRIGSYNENKVGVRSNIRNSRSPAKQTSTGGGQAVDLMYGETSQFDTVNPTSHYFTKKRTIHH